jgi:hypothetical protein
MRPRFEPHAQIDAGQERNVIFEGWSTVSVGPITAGGGKHTALKNGRKAA